MAFGPFGKIFRACSGAGCEIVFKVMRCTTVFFFFFLNPIYIPRESGDKLRTPEATTGEM